MARARTNGIEIEYETFGNPSDEPLLLIMGLGGQMILWHEDFCSELARRGHYVIRFDNRDVGLSTKLDEAGLPNIIEMFMAAQQGQPVSAPYTLDDMADDVAGLLDALAIERAHVCGVSMGGMIAQTLAIRHPRRLKTLTSIMSTTGAMDLPPPRPEAAQVLLIPIPSDREGYIERTVNVFRAIGSPGFPFDEAQVRERAALSYDRCCNPFGQARQLAAILAHGSRREGLRRVRIPTLVIHGADDPLVPVECGHDTAACIPDAEILVIDGLGHDNPRGAWPVVIDALTRHTQRSTRPSAPLTAEA